jgi:hypothetical protein
MKQEVNHAELIKTPSVRLDKLEMLSDLTQQLYLGLPSFLLGWKTPP